MNIKKLKLSLLIIGSLLGFSLYGATDERIKRIPYQENKVVYLQGDTFTATQVIFGEDEVVLVREGGDRAVWMVSNPLPNMVIIKPTGFNSNSNITVATNKHNYYFHVVSNANKVHKTYAIQFTYPKEEALKRKAQALRKEQEEAEIINPSLHPERYNWNYRFSGSKELVPLHVFDDNRFTYLEMAANQPIPAIFAVDKAGKEAAVNTRRSGNYLVILRLSPQFSLRLGKVTTSIFNVSEINRIREGRRPQ